MRSMLGLAALALAGSVISALPSAAGWLEAPVHGSCGICCSPYPSGWRGMCLRRCLSERRVLPPWQRRDMPCECQLNWRRVWACGGRW
jgi:hypothetical protein